MLASSSKRNSLSLESGLKYFILGSIASGLLLFGIALIYGFTGTLDFNSLSLLFYQHAEINSFVWLGFVLIFITILFKLGVFPFHMWLPDVYAGSSIYITGFFAVIPKLPFFFIFI